MRNSLGPSTNFLPEEVDANTDESQNTQDDSTDIESTGIALLINERQSAIWDTKWDDSTSKAQNHKRSIAEGWITINSVSERSHDYANEAVELSIEADNDGRPMPLGWILAGSSEYDCCANRNAEWKNEGEKTIFGLWEGVISQWTFHNTNGQTHLCNSISSLTQVFRNKITQISLEWYHNEGNNNLSGKDKSNPVKAKVVWWRNKDSSKDGTKHDEDSEKCSTAQH